MIENKNLLSMMFRVLGDVRARREGVTPLTSWRKAERREKQNVGNTPISILCERSGKTRMNLNYFGCWTGECSTGQDWSMWSLRVPYVTENLLGSTLRT